MIHTEEIDKWVEAAKFYLEIMGQLKKVK